MTGESLGKGAAAFVVAEVGADFVEAVFSVLSVDATGIRVVVLCFSLPVIACEGPEGMSIRVEG